MLSRHRPSDTLSTNCRKRLLTGSLSARILHGSWPGTRPCSSTGRVVQTVSSSLLSGLRQENLELSSRSQPQPSIHSAWFAQRPGLGPLGGRLRLARRRVLVTIDNKWCGFCTDYKSVIHVSRFCPERSPFDLGQEYL